MNAILEMAQFKRDGSCKKLIVTGCLAERYREQLKAEIPEIDVCLALAKCPTSFLPSPASQRASLSPARAEALTEHSPAAPSAGLQPRPQRGQQPARASNAPRRPHHVSAGADTPRVLTTPSHFAHVKIAEGCDYTCAFCIIPTLARQALQP